MAESFPPSSTSPPKVSGGVQGGGVNMLYTVDPLKRGQPHPLPIVVITFVTSEKRTASLQGTKGTLVPCREVPLYIQLSCINYGIPLLN